MSDNSKNTIHARNRQKLLFMVSELHHLGFCKFRVVPSLSPSGIYWRCNFVNKNKTETLNVTDWLYKLENQNGVIENLPNEKELTELFVIDNKEFINKCFGDDIAYKNWYSLMLQHLKEGELPFALADYGVPKGTWLTTDENEIKILLDDEQYYFY